MKDHPIQQHKAPSQDLEGETEGKGKSLSAPAFQLMAGDAPAAPAIQRKESSGGGLPSDLVNGFAASTGHDLSDVNVHRNSAKPSQVGALAYAQGNDIHLGAGQEQHLAHEAAHIVQQREGRVQATTEVGGMPVNDSASLESEADSMGAKAAQMKGAGAEIKKQSITESSSAARTAVQRKLLLEGDAKAIQDAVKLMNASMFGYSVSVDKSGYLKIEANGQVGPPSPQQSAMYNHLKKMMDDPQDVRVQVDSGNKAVIVGSYALNTIDMADIGLFGSGGGGSSAGALIHELVEQYHKQVKGTAYGSDTSGAHGEGVAAENEVNGCVRGSQKATSYKDNGDGTFDAVVEIPYTYANGRVVTSILTITKGDLVKVEQKETKAAIK